VILVKSASNGSVLDRLILTDTALVWRVHGDDGTQDATDARAYHLDSNHTDSNKAQESKREVTMALVRYKSPLAAMRAAAPTRLLHMLGLPAAALGPMPDQGFAAALGWSDNSTTPY
jgi:putative ABC transport system permease protein